MVEIHTVKQIQKSY